MIIQPYLVGSGRAGQALLKSLSFLEITDEGIELKKPILLKRDQPLSGFKSKEHFSLLLIANPHGLHAQKLLEADTHFDLIVTEKPACTRMEDVVALKKLQTPVAVCHGYRQMWGVQTLKAMLNRGDFGELVAIEGRYWQSSTAQRALAVSSEQKKLAAQSWKNDVALSGPYDALLDTGSHWADAAMYLMGQKPKETHVWLSYINAEAAHRDTHVHLQMTFDKSVRALCSVSKTIHGATNHFEINIIGSKKFATWNFLAPDQIEVGEGSLRSFVSRSGYEYGAKQAPYHGVGWLEGYIEILRQSIRHVRGEKYEKYPDLKEALVVVETLLQAKIQKT